MIRYDKFRLTALLPGFIVRFSHILRFGVVCRRAAAAAICHSRRGRRRFVDVEPVMVHVEHLVSSLEIRNARYYFADEIPAIIISQAILELHVCVFATYACFITTTKADQLRLRQHALLVSLCASQIDAKLRSSLKAVSVCEVISLI